MKFIVANLTTGEKIAFNESDKFVFQPEWDESKESNIVTSAELTVKKFWDEFVEPHIYHPLGKANEIINHMIDHVSKPMEEVK